MFSLLPEFDLGLWGSGYIGNLRFKNSSRKGIVGEMTVPRGIGGEIPVYHWYAGRTWIVEGNSVLVGVCRAIRLLAFVLSQ